MANANALFNQADLNGDQQIDLNEFQNFIGSNLSNSNAAGNWASVGTGGGYQSLSASGANLGGNLSLSGAGLNDAGYGASSYESTSYSSSIGGSANGIIGGLANVGEGAGIISTSGINNLASANYSSSVGVQSYETDAQGLYKDPNPQIVHRPAPGGAVTYTQNIKVRFLQPPPIPPPGPIIIKEVRPPQPPLPPPLRIRQQAPSLPQPPPLILRERPPIAPSAAGSQTVIRKLAAIPVPPRSVITERLPALPAKPRDIIIERWIPYGAQAQRKTIVQRAAAAQQYSAPRNVIIIYEPVQVRVVRQFQRLGVAQENPQVYAQRYGALLLDAQSLVQQARAAGVVEDISPPGIAGSWTAGSSESISSGGAIGSASGLGNYNSGTTGINAGGAYQSSSYTESINASGGGSNLGVAGLVGAELGGAASYGSISGIASGNAEDAWLAGAHIHHGGI